MIITIGWNNDMRQTIAKHNADKAHKKQCITIIDKLGITHINHNQQQWPIVNKVIFSNDGYGDFADSKILQQFREMSEKD